MKTDKDEPSYDVDALNVEDFLRSSATTNRGQHLFDVGQIKVSSLAIIALTRRDILALLRRHSSGDAGIIHDGHAMVNRLLLACKPTSATILSLYELRGTSILIATNLSKKTTHVTTGQEKPDHSYLTLNNPRSPPTFTVGGDLC